MTKFGVICLLLSWFVGCNNSSSEMIVSQENDEQEELSYLALGDSYTIGESVEERLRWPVQLSEELRQRGFEIEDPKIIAKTGWTTQDLLNAMDNQLTGEEQYDLVSVLIGVNNQYQGKSIEAYEEELNEIFTRAIALSRNGREGVFVVSIPDYGATPFGAPNAEEIGREIDEFNAVFKRVAKEFRLEFYDITPISRRATQEPDLVADDDLHPSGKMYELWVAEFADEVAAKLE